MKKTQQNLEIAINGIPDWKCFPKEIQDSFIVSFEPLISEIINKANPKAMQ